MFDLGEVILRIFIQRDSTDATQRKLFLQKCLRQIEWTRRLFFGIDSGVSEGDSSSSGTSDFARWSQAELRELYKTHYLVDRIHRSQPMRTAVFPCTGFQKRIFWKDSFRSGAKCSNRFDFIELIRRNKQSFRSMTLVNRCRHYDWLMQRDNQKNILILSYDWMNDACEWTNGDRCPASIERVDFLHSIGSS